MRIALGRPRPYQGEVSPCLLRLYSMGEEVIRLAPWGGGESAGTRGALYLRISGEFRVYLKEQTVKGYLLYS
jgi:hypothetical protein